MNETYVSGGSTRMSSGGFILAAMSLLAAVLVLGGLYYALGTGERHKVALAAGDCEPNLSPSGLPCTTVPMLVSQYAKMTTPVIQQLNTDAAAFTASEFGNLAAAEAALTAQVALGNSLSASLARFPFPPAVAPAAKKLIQADDALVRLESQQARSSSLVELRSFDGQILAAGAVVQTDVQLVSRDLHKSPTPNQEP